MELHEGSVIVVKPSGKLMEARTYSEHFILMPIKHMCYKAPMRPEILSSHHVGHTFFLLCHISHMVPMRIHYHVSVRLFEPAFSQNLVSLHVRSRHRCIHATHIITFIISNCLWTTNPEFANIFVAGWLPLRTPFGSSGM